VESKPLTEEQDQVVVCFDNRVQVVALAGSGKWLEPHMRFIGAS
jgi:DNA helicase-4